MKIRLTGTQQSMMGRMTMNLNGKEIQFSEIDDIIIICH